MRTLLSTKSFPFLILRSSQAGVVEPECADTAAVSWGVGATGSHATPSAQTRDAQRINALDFISFLRGRHR